ncbi:LysR substrate-binding domain-containing protein [Paracoccus sp. MC1862]|uniref:LysR substrate-binding domain-containing protein n=1 Tax=Paracoccus sp. MC1862 TaxID=2760307 RepID=UPI0016032BA7|nr:LysR substrate-binding domain-containing protein [Paracoccus sp. MC1862]MBB1497557.1 LysR family transcriptional regulator [Paracoccus sp. MC1862]QQO44006.1 LysR family transcriptional regulator [Paracoccus sp. MC1862]
MENLPPLAALRVFESVARHLSFTAAARDLGMTQAGVSYQVRLLEERLGGPLFLRKPKGIELTALGARLAGPTREAFDLLRAAYAPQAEADSLSISTLQTLAGNWLSQRLGHFQSENPHLSVRMEASDHLVDFAREDIDVAIRFGDGNWPGLAAQRLFTVDFTPMLSPALIARHGPLTGPEQIVPLPWIARDDPSWGIWLAAAGVRLSCDDPPRPSLTLGTQIHEARLAMAGNGVAMLTPRFFRFELAAGALVQPFALTATDGKAYWLVHPPARRNRPAIRAFRRFLLAEVAGDGA